MKRSNALLRSYQIDTRRKLDKGGSLFGFNSKTQSAVSASGTILSAGIDALAPKDRFGVQTGFGAATSGMAKGAAAGAQFGIIGAGVGAAVGGIAGVLGNNKAKREKQSYLTDESQMNIEERDAQIKSRLSMNPELTYGNTNAQMYRYGGTVKGKPSTRFGSTLRIPTSVRLAPDLLPDIAISPTKMLRHGGEHGTDTNPKEKAYRDSVKKAMTEAEGKDVISRLTPAQYANAKKVAEKNAAEWEKLGYTNSEPVSASDIAQCALGATTTLNRAGEKFKGKDSIDGAYFGNHTLAENIKNDGYKKSSVDKAKRGDIIQFKEKPTWPSHTALYDSPIKGGPGQTIGMRTFQSDGHSPMKFKDYLDEGYAIPDREKEFTERNGLPNYRKPAPEVGDSMDFQKIKRKEAFKTLDIFTKKFAIGGELPDPKNPSRPDPEDRKKWNGFVDFLDKKGMKGSADLDKRDTNLSKTLFEEYAKGSNLDVKYDEFVPKIQTGISEYRTKSLEDIKAGKAVFNGKEEDFMKGLSNVDGWAGSRTTSWKFPDEKIIDPTQNRVLGKNTIYSKLEKGGIIPTSSRTSIVKGPSHEDGGVKLPEQGVEVEGGESMTDDFVFSKSLGFADIHERIGKAMGKNEKRPDTPMKQNTSRALVRKEGFLKIYQEMDKKAKGMPNEIDNSAEEAKTAKAEGPLIMRNGGSLPKMQGGGKIRVKRNGQWVEVTPAQKAAWDRETANNFKATQAREALLPKTKVGGGESIGSKIATGFKDLYNKWNSNDWAEPGPTSPVSKARHYNPLTNKDQPGYRVPGTTAPAPRTATPPAIPKVTFPSPINTVSSIPSIPRTTTPRSTPRPTPGKPAVKKAIVPPVKLKVPVAPFDKGNPDEAAPEIREIPKPIAMAQVKNSGAPLGSGKVVDTILPALPGAETTKKGLNLNVDMSKVTDGLNAIAPFASNIANSFRKLPAPPKPTMDATINADLVNLDANRAEAVRQRRGADKGAAAGLNGNNQVAAVKAANLSGQIREMNNINQTESNINVGIKNQTVQANAQITRGNNLKKDFYNTQQVERQLKQQELASENLADVGNKQQMIQRDKAAAELDDDKMILTMAQDETGASFRAGDAVLKRRLSPEAYTQVKAMAAKMELANAEDRKIYQEGIRNMLANGKVNTETILADAKAKKAQDQSANTQARTSKTLSGSKSTSTMFNDYLLNNRK